MTKVVVIGSGGHAKVIIDILRERPDLELIGCLARDAGGNPVCGVPIIGDDSVLPTLLQSGIEHVFVALGDNRLRSRLFLSALSHGLKMVNAISSHAILSPSVTLGSGIAVMPGAVMNVETSVGDGVIVNTGATVDHECVLQPMSHIGPGSSLAGCVHVGTGSFLGTGVRVIPGVRIGEWSVIGAGAAVVTDVPHRVLSVGVPARIIKTFK